MWTLRDLSSFWVWVVREKMYKKHDVHKHELYSTGKPDVSVWIDCSSAKAILYVYIDKTLCLNMNYIYIINII